MSRPSTLRRIFTCAVGGDDYVISLNENGMPKLRLSPQYRELLAELNNGRGSQDKEYCKIASNLLRGSSKVFTNVSARFTE